jgi:Secretion system C-terminal sorting domain
MKNVVGFMVLLVIFTNISLSQISATFVGDTTKIWDTNFGWSCGGRFFPIITTSNDTIYITECDTLELATCSCNYTVCTSLIGLNAGIYNAIITRQWKFYEYYSGGSIHIDTVIGFSENAGSVTFTILHPPVLSKSLAFYQSGCLGEGQGVAEEKTVPNEFAMLTNYPNPFNPSTTIHFTIPRQCHASLIIYNITGQHIATLFDENKYAGTYNVAFNGQNLSSGVYLCRLDMGGQILSKKIILLK